MTNSRIEEILSLIQDLASGNLEARRGRSERNDELDAVIEGLNMLGEELAAQTVSLTRYQVLVGELREALREVKTLTGFLPSARGARTSAKTMATGKVWRHILQSIPMLHSRTGSVRTAWRN